MNNIKKELDEVIEKYSGNLHRDIMDGADNEKLILHVTKVFKDAKDYINRKSSSNLVNLVNVPSDLNSLLFNYEGGKGFLLTFGKSRLVLVLFESMNYVTFVGRESGSNNKNIKLLRLGVSSGKTSTYGFTDNSGARVQLHEAALQVVKWGMS